MAEAELLVTDKDENCDKAIDVLNSLNFLDRIPVTKVADGADLPVLITKTGQYRGLRSIVRVALNELNRP